MKKINASFSNYSKLICFLMFVVFLGGCASGLSKSVKVTDDDMAKYGAMSSQEAVSSLEEALAEAKIGELPLYTPSHYHEAEKLYSKALELLGQNKKKQDIVRNVAKADRLLARAKIKKLEVASELGDLLIINKNLVVLNAPTVFKKEYAGLNKGLTSLIVKVENNKADNIEKNKNKLLKSFSALEVKSIKYGALHEADEIKIKAKALKALKLAPKTYAKAVTVYQQSDLRISQEPHNKENVADAKKQALFAAKHALLVTERVISLGVTFKKKPEKVVLEEENRLLSVSRIFDDSDFRDLQIEEQVAKITQSINQLAAENKTNIASVKENAGLAESFKALEQELSENKKTLLESSEVRDKIKAELAERDVVIVKMTADLLRSQNKEKELTALIVQQNAVAFESKMEKSESFEAEVQKVKAVNVEVKEDKEESKRSDSVEIEEKV